jgi:hypothetical protein
MVSAQKSVNNMEIGTIAFVIIYVAIYVGVNDWQKEILKDDEHDDYRSY